MFDPYELLAAAEGFDWDEGNGPKVVARHSVTLSECEQTFFVEPLLVSADAEHSGVELRWRALGCTMHGRYLHLVFTMRGVRIRVIHAREMNRKERQAYEQAKARIEEDS